MKAREAAPKLAAIAAAVAVIAAAELLPLPRAMLEAKGALLSSQGRAALASLVFALVLWVTEALPFHVTGLLAMLVMALLGAGSFPDIVRYGFGDDVVVFFIGVLAVAAALRRSGLAGRAGRLVRRLAGSSTRAMIFAFLAVGAFLAMWLTALGAVAIVAPLAQGILSDEGEKPGSSRFGTGLMIAAAWGPLIGALGTPAGSGSNPVAVRFLSEMAGFELGFPQWMAFGVPAMLALLPVAFLVIVAFFTPERSRLKTATSDGSPSLPLSREEKAVGLIFVATAALWVASPTIGKALGVKLPLSVGALVAVVALFVPGISPYRWKDLEKDIDWSGILLIATGISLGTALYKTGAAAWVAASVLGGVGALPPFLRLAAVSLGVFCIKVVFSSNTLTGTIIVPLVLALGTTLGLDARGMALAAALTSNLAFILVTTSPVNVLPYTAGYFSIRDMAKAGIVLAAAAALVVAASVTLIGKVFGIM